MTIAKFLAAAALAAPFSSVCAQTAAPADSGRTSDRAVWLAGTATGGALFVLFTRSGQGASSSSTSGGFGGFTAAPASPNAPTPPASGTGSYPVPSPAGGSTTGSTSPGGSGDGSAPSAPTTPPYTPPSPDNGSSGLTFVNVPHDTSSSDQTQGHSPDEAGEPQDTPPGHFDSLFAPTQSSEESFVQSVDETSTVPEPASLALTATGIVGLLPLIRRRK